VSSEQRTSDINQGSEGSRKPRHALYIWLVLMGVVIGLAAYFRPWHGPSPAAASRAPAAGSAADKTQLPLSSGLTSQAAMASLLEQVQVCGASDQAAKRILARSLLDLETPEVAGEYWVPRRTRDFNRRQASAEASAKVRARVIQLAGESAKEDPAFRALFRPLDDEFPFLSSAQQIELERLQLAAERRRAELSTQADNPQTYMRIHQELLAGVRQLLTTEEFFEYQLRESPAAQSLLVSGFQFSEQEFRNVFRAVIELSGAGSSGADGSVQIPVPDRRAAMDRIRAVLGDARFAEYRRAQDPTYRVLLAIGQSHGLPSRTVEQAYAYVASQEPELPSVTASRAQPLRSPNSAPQTELKRLLGEAAYRDFAARTEGEQAFPATPVMRLPTPVSMVQAPHQ